MSSTEEGNVILVFGRPGAWDRDIAYVAETLRHGQKEARKYLVQSHVSDGEWVVILDAMRGFFRVLLTKKDGEVVATDEITRCPVRTSLGVCGCPMTAKDKDCGRHGKKRRRHG